jgi:multicomponent Na+:H+ antiporter subunit G
MAQSLSPFLLLLGAIFMLLAAIGLARMPDVLMRLHSTTKSNTLGVGLIMLGIALRFYETDSTIAVRALAIVIFMFSTAPVAAHMIGRAAYLSGVPLWEGTLSDEMRGCYDAETHTLSSHPQTSNPNLRQG